MTVAAVIHFCIECPVHSDKCAYQWFSPVKNIDGSILGLCEKCGYQTELGTKFGVKYRRLDDASVFLSEAEFERGKK